MGAYIGFGDAFTSSTVNKLIRHIHQSLGVNHIKTMCETIGLKVQRLGFGTPWRCLVCLIPVSSGLGHDVYLQVYGHLSMFDSIKVRRNGGGGQTKATTYRLKFGVAPWAPGLELWCEARHSLVICGNGGVSALLTCWRHCMIYMLLPFRRRFFWRTPCCGLFLAWASG
jgi:hypothetical protein